jgi:hypothetical protein
MTIEHTVCPLPSFSRECGDVMTAGAFKMSAREVMALYVVASGAEVYCDTFAEAQALVAEFSH